jgi:hypothetical protein
MREQAPAAGAALEDIGRQHRALRFALVADVQGFDDVVHRQQHAVPAHAARQAYHQARVVGEDAAPTVADRLGTGQALAGRVNADDLFVVGPDAHQGDQVGTCDGFVEGRFDILGVAKTTSCGALVRQASERAAGRAC